MFSREDVLAAIASDCAYKAPKKGEKVEELKCIDAHADSRVDSYMGIFEDEQGVVYIAMRGTASMKNWGNNLNFSLQDWEYATQDKLVKVHGGFLNTFLSLRFPLDEKLEAWQKKKKVVVCGHSLGGAVATLTGAYLLDHGVKHVQVVTFASPHVGNDAFCQKYAKLSHRRFTTPYDPVPAVLLAKGGFEHHGVEVSLKDYKAPYVVIVSVAQARMSSDPVTALGKGPWLELHAMERYLNAIHPNRRANGLIQAFGRMSKSIDIKKLSLLVSSPSKGAAVSSSAMVTFCGVGSLGMGLLATINTSMALEEIKSSQDRMSQELSKMSTTLDKLADWMQNGQKREEIKLLKERIREHLEHEEWRDSNSAGLLQRDFTSPLLYLRSQLEASIRDFDGSRSVLERVLELVREEFKLRSIRAQTFLLYAASILLEGKVESSNKSRMVATLRSFLKDLKNMEDPIKETGRLLSRSTKSRFDFADRCAPVLLQLAALLLALQHREDQVKVWVDWLENGPQLDNNTLHSILEDDKLWGSEMDTLEFPIDDGFSAFRGELGKLKSTGGDSTVKRFVPASLALDTEWYKSWCGATSAMRPSHIDVEWVMRELGMDKDVQSRLSSLGSTDLVRLLEKSTQNMRDRQQALVDIFNIEGQEQVDLTQVLTQQVRRMVRGSNGKAEAHVHVPRIVAWMKDNIHDENHVVESMEYLFRCGTSKQFSTLPCYRQILGVMQLYPANASIQSLGCQLLGQVDWNADSEARFVVETAKQVLHNKIHGAGADDRLIAVATEALRHLASRVDPKLMHFSAEPSFFSQGVNYLASSGREKWDKFSAGEEMENANVFVEFDQPHTVYGYELCSADGQQASDPCSWEVWVNFADDQPREWNHVESKKYIKFVGRWQWQAFFLKERLVNVRALKFKLKCQPSKEGLQLGQMNVFGNIELGDSELKPVDNALVKFSADRDIRGGGTGKEYVHCLGHIPNTPSNKWYTGSTYKIGWTGILGGGPVVNATLTLTLKETISVKGYRFCTANDAPWRDPKNWQVCAYNSESRQEEVVDERQGQLFSRRYEWRTFIFDVPVKTNRILFKITKFRGEKDGTQLAKVRLLHC